MDYTLLDVARRNILSCGRNDLLSDVANSMQKNNIGSVIVKDGEDNVGIFTTGDILRTITHHRDITGMTAKDIMTSPIVTAPEDTQLDAGLKLFVPHKITRLVLINKEGKISGVAKYSVVEHLHYLSNRKKPKEY